MYPLKVRRLGSPPTFCECLLRCCPRGRSLLTSRRGETRRDETRRDVSLSSSPPALPRRRLGWVWLRPQPPISRLAAISSLPSRCHLAAISNAISLPSRGHLRCHDLAAIFDAMISRYHDLAEISHATISRPSPTTISPPSALRRGDAHPYQVRAIPYQVRAIKYQVRAIKYQVRAIPYQVHAIPWHTPPVAIAGVGPLTSA